MVQNWDHQSFHPCWTLDILQRALIATDFQTLLLMHFSHEAGFEERVGSRGGDGRLCRRPCLRVRRQKRQLQRDAHPRARRRPQQDQERNK